MYHAGAGLPGVQPGKDCEPMECRHAAGPGAAACAALALLSVLAPGAPAQAPVTEIAFVPGPARELPWAGSVVGLTMAGADTLAVLLDVPADGRGSARRVRLLVQAPGLLHRVDREGPQSVAQVAPGVEIPVIAIENQPLGRKFAGCLLITFAVVVDHFKPFPGK